MSNIDLKHIARGGVYHVFWLLVVAAFVVGGIHGRKVLPPPVGTDGEGPYGSSDSMLFSSLQVHGGSGKILDAIRDLPLSRPLVVFEPVDNSRAVNTYQIVSYLAWPRQVWAAPIQESLLGKAYGDFTRSQFGAMFFYVLKPPVTAATDRHIGPLTLVAVPETGK